VNAFISCPGDGGGQFRWHSKHAKHTRPTLSFAAAGPTTSLTVDVSTRYVGHSADDSEASGCTRQFERIGHYGPSFVLGALDGPIALQARDALKGRPIQNNTMSLGAHNRSKPVRAGTLRARKIAKKAESRVIAR